MDKNMSLENNMEKEKVHLAEPDIRYKDSYIEALHEFSAIDGDTHTDIEDREKNFEKYLAKLENDKNASEGLVPNIQYWLTDGDKYIGRINYRPELDDNLRFRGGNIGYAIRPSERGKGYASKMMEMIIEKARSEGKKELLVTCDSDNIPSTKVIEKAGGKYLSSDVGGEKNTAFNRYIITL
jgi:predicted acetyltransferase